MNTAAQDHPTSTLRISDADRDRAIAELSEHFQAGRLTTEELEDRTAQALQARTAADLATLFADLPRPRPPVPGATPTPAPAPARSSRLARGPAAPIAVIAVVVLLTLLSGYPFHIVWVPVLAVIVVRLLAGRARRCRAPR